MQILTLTDGTTAKNTQILVLPWESTKKAVERLAQKAGLNRINYFAHLARGKCWSSTAFDRTKPIGILWETPAKTIKKP